MRITFRMTGGFAGLVRGCELDAEALPEDVGAELQRLVAACGFSESSSRQSPDARDALNYELRIETAVGDVTVSFDEASMSPECELLLDFLEPHLGPRPLS